MRFKIDWACLIVGSKFTVFALFTLYLRAIFQVQAPRGAYILRGLFLEGLIFGGDYLRKEICVSKSIGLALWLFVNFFLL